MEGVYALVDKPLLEGENILEGDSAVDEDKAAGDITLLWGAILEAEASAGGLPVKPTALLRIPENVLLVFSVLCGIPPVVDDRFIGRIGCLLWDWTVELVGKAFLLSTIPAPNRELPGYILSDDQLTHIKWINFLSIFKLQ